MPYEPPPEIAALSLAELAEAVAARDERIVRTGNDDLVGVEPKRERAFGGCQVGCDKGRVVDRD